MATDKPTLFPARVTDPITSVNGAIDLQLRSPSQRLRLLAAFFWAGPIGLTDEEAAEHTGLVNQRRACWWRRCGELRSQGLIEFTDGTRTGDAGSDRAISVITPKGVEEFHDASEKYTFS